MSILSGINNKNDKENEPTHIKSKTLEDIIRLANDEVVVKDYYAADVKKPTHGEAHFALTNKRLIWYIWTDETVKVNSVNILDIVVTSVYKTEHSFAIIINVKACNRCFYIFYLSSFNSRKRIKSRKFRDGIISWT